MSSVGTMSTAGPLVDADTLAELLGVTAGDEVARGAFPVGRAPAPIQVLDVRWSLGGPPGIVGFLAGHVPGARHADLETVFAQLPADPVDERGRHPLPDPAALAVALWDLGVRTDVPVVLVDAGNGMAAARAWWVLRWAGFPAAAVRVLDGGQAAWEQAGLPVVAGPFVLPDPAQAAAPQEAAGGPVGRPGSTPGQQSSDQPQPAEHGGPRRPGRSPVGAGPVVLDAAGGHLPTVDGAGVAALGGAAGPGVLVDARAPERWRGDVEPVDPRAGHIPGAVNLPWDSDMAPDGRWRSPAELAGRLRAAGIGGPAPAVVSCGSGVSAAHLVLAAEIAGLTLPALYPGSFSGWVADPEHPVDVG